MRINIYEEELGEGYEIVTKATTNDGTFYGLRIWLKTCQPLLDHSTPEDDDRSAVTFWGRDITTLWSIVYSLKLVVGRWQEEHPDPMKADTSAQEA